MARRRSRSRHSLGKRIAFVLLTLLLIGLTTAAMCMVALALYINYYVKPNSEIDVKSLSMKFNSVIYYQDDDEKEQVLQKLASSENREWVDMSDIPEDMANAFVAIEDKRFYEHNGVDWKRTAGAILNYMLPMGSSYGGSTITQQLVKNMTGENDVSVKRKITEIVRALSLEEQADKKTILELYMNIIYLGENSYGVQTAAKTYFNKSVDKLDLAQCALIAGLTKNPSGYDPFNSPEKAKKRQKSVLSEMYKQGYISKTEYTQAVNEKLQYQEEAYTSNRTGAYSYFTDMVITDVENDLKATYGYSDAYASALVSSGGLSIYATMDNTVQKRLESVFEDDDYFPGISAQGERPQASMMILDPKSGAILGVVGGRGEKTESRVLNRATQTKRAPGSCIKPLSVYAPALDEGLITPYSVVTDMPFEVDEDGLAWPKNENRTYRGQTTIMNGVASSTNTVAVRVLDMLTPKKSYDFLTQKLGFTTLVGADDEDYAPLALGGLTDGATVREMAQGYTALANYGEYSEAISYTKVVDANGNTILSHEDNEPEQVFEQTESTPYYINDILSYVCKEGTGRKAKMRGIETAGKTGTTTDNKDRWFAGYTPYYLGVCWFGYDSQYSIPDLDYNPALRLWTYVMEDLHDPLPNKKFKQSDDFEYAEYCMDSGLSPTSACEGDPRGSRAEMGWFYKDDVPEENCNLHEWRYRSASMLDLTRRFPLSITVTDEYYCFDGSNDAIGEGTRVSSPNGHYTPPPPPVQHSSSSSSSSNNSSSNSSNSSNNSNSNTNTEDTTGNTDTDNGYSDIVDSANGAVTDVTDQTTYDSTGQFDNAA